MNMEKMKYRVEFNEEKQHWHLHSLNKAYPTENSFGYYTILKDSDDFDFHCFQSFVDSFMNEKYSIEFLKKCAKNYECFKDNLLKNNLQISKL